MLYEKLTNLLKFEYCLLKDREKSQIVKTYIENEYIQIENDKNEIQREREKYSSLLEMERQLQEDKKKLEEKRIEFKQIVDNFKKSFKQIYQDSDINFYGTLMGREGVMSTEVAHHSKKQSGVYGGLSRIDNSMYQSAFDSAMHRTSNLISNIFSPQKNFMMKHQQIWTMMQDSNLEKYS